MDTGSDDVPEYIGNLRQVLERESCNLSDVIVTHWHRDHLGGLPQVLGCLPPSSAGKLHIATRETCRATLLNILAFAGGGLICRVWKHPRYNEENKTDDPLLNDLRDGQVFVVEGATVRILHTPGHADDHVALLLEEENALFSGDCVLGEGTVVFEDLHDYMLSLGRILELKPSVIYPGHGNVLNKPVETVCWYMKHRNEREKQILGALENHTSNPLASTEIVRLIYVDTPDHLLPAADFNVRHHLSKLLKEKKVTHTEDDKWLCVA